MPKKDLYTNRLIREKSPYLLQHAHNPVDWYPWGEEAFALAKQQDRPIFLSIGYATCHWCHVMDRESFQSVELAKQMNELFVNIKVDREEMPEIDSLYMEFAQAMMSGGAGWPLNLVLTPELNPFFASTYLPPDSARGFLGMKQLLDRISQVWSDPRERENVIEQSGKIVDLFSEHAVPPKHEIPPKEMIEQCAEMIFEAADPVYGGMKGAPKFPIGFQASLLLREAQKRSDSRALFFVERTLEMMHRGGLYDHLGGGFARYSVDEQWLIPHFEKMLYDNAILAQVYTEAYCFTKNSFYRETAEHLLDYLLREMHSKEGAFYSAEDADSEGKEGIYYTWSYEEVQKELKENAPLFSEFYGITPSGNFHGRNVLHMPYSLAEFSEYRRLEKGKLDSLLKQMRETLLGARSKRSHLSKDDKVITSYNALMISALVSAGVAFERKDYLEGAQICAKFIWENLQHEGMLLRRFREGEAKFDGCLDDYAFMIQALISLFEADCGSIYLEWALELHSTLESEFKADNGAYFLTNGRDPNLILRRCEFYDGAEPSGNAVSAENLLRLFQITADRDYFERAQELFEAAAEHIEMYPPGASYNLMALLRYYDRDAPTYLIALNEKEEGIEEIKKILADHYVPNKAVIWSRAQDRKLQDLSMLVRQKQTLSGKTTLYICYSDRCQEPLTSIEKIQEHFDK
ncbi:MAG: hypothetical protein S4CHLAM81_10330 [Chlamydiales bacterium]|nr:hypothetical protein [Chlamydiales bacterium]MCH9635811.1 hypothetical protein [Chlamydiales bacterium]MCH9703938.1 thioredoxin domain-containing protein [Chlamydiota bacterium]